MAKISVVIPVIGQEQCSSKTIFSILNQSFQDFEVIILSNNSVNKELLLDDRIKSYLLPDISNLSEILNLSANYANADLICFVAHQDLLLHYSLAQRYELFQKNPELSANYGFGIEVGNDFKSSKSDCYDWIYNFTPNPKNNFESILSLDIFPSISSLMIKKEILNNLNFDKKYEMNYVWDFFIRLFQKNKAQIAQNRIPVYLTISHCQNKPYPIKFLSEAILILDKNFISAKFNDQIFKTYYKGYKNAFLTAYLLNREYFKNSYLIRIVIFFLYLKKNIQLNGKIFSSLLFKLFLADFNVKNDEINAKKPCLI